VQADIKRTSILERKAVSAAHSETPEGVNEPPGGIRKREDEARSEMILICNIGKRYHHKSSCRHYLIPVGNSVRLVQPLCTTTWPAYATSGNGTVDN
jgi:hypothetical protein